MSNNTEIKVNEISNEWIGWIEEAVSKKHIKYYDYNHFSNIQEIGCGSSGRVYRVCWRKPHKYFALKSFYKLNQVTAKEVINEVFII